jgi:hypothetical protein
MTTNAKVFGRLGVKADAAHYGRTRRTKWRTLKMISFKESNQTFLNSRSKSYFFKKFRFFFWSWRRACCQLPTFRFNDDNLTLLHICYLSFAILPFVVSDDPLNICSLVQSGGRD